MSITGEKVKAAVFSGSSMALILPLSALAADAVDVFLGFEDDKGAA